MDVPKKRILVCPLDWGLGHVTRCIPVINELRSQGAEVIIAADRGPLQLLRDEFPELEYLRLPGANIKYSDKLPLALSILFTLPAFIVNLNREHRILKKFIKEKNIHAVISDNRYGLWSKEIPSVFITHQLNIHGKVATGFIRKINHYFIKKYRECWIPDIEEEVNLSGDLSHGKKIPSNCVYIGPLSRFKKEPAPISKEKYLLAIISGPEDQRTVFENLVTEQLLISGKRAIVLRGKPEEKENLPDKKNIHFENHLSSDQMNELILNSEIVISRSGYSTIMDLAVLGKKAILVPTSGQTEQEYLALRCYEKKQCYSAPQKKFSLDDALKESGSFTGIDLDDKNNLLPGKIRELLSWL